MGVNALELPYYSLEANQKYMSASLYKKFLNCEAATMAELRGEWQDEPTEAMVVGNYFHTFFEGEEAHAAFVAQHEDKVFNRKGEKYAAFKQADKMIETIANDSFIAKFLVGEKEQVIITEFAGTQWKAKLDVYNPIGRIVDLKTVRSLYEKVWSKEDSRYQSWVEAYGYVRQLALYVELERRWSKRGSWLQPLIIGVTKEDIPDKAVLSIPEDVIAEELALVEANMPHILSVKNGEVEPHRCEQCRFCRATKKVKRIVDYRDLLV